MVRQFADLTISTKPNMKEKIDTKSLALGLLLGGFVLFLGAAASRNQPADVLRVRKLVIVDDKGAERVVIAAQVPDPQMGGKRSPRRSPMAGIQFNDASGNERGVMPPFFSLARLSYELF